MGKFCVMHFVKVIKPLVGKHPFVSEDTYDFRNGSRLVAPLRKFNMYKSWMSPNLNEVNWCAFVMRLCSTSRSLSRRGSKQDLIENRFYFALLEQNTSSTLQCRCKCSCNSINCFFICKNWLDEQFSLIQSSRFLSNFLIFSRQLWRWMSSHYAAYFILYCCFIIKEHVFVFALLWEAVFSSARLKLAMRWCGSKLQKKIGSSTNFEETEVETIFPIHIVVFVSLDDSSWTQLESELNFVKILKSLC